MQMPRYLLPSPLALLAAAFHCASAQLRDIDHRNLVGPFLLDPDVDCAMRNLTWAYSLHLQPSRAPLVDVFDALRLAIDCNQTRPSPASASASGGPFYAVHSHRAGSGSPTILRTLAVGASAVFADAVHGLDTNAGTEAAPFLTVGRALAASRASGGAPLPIVLRGGGVFALPSPLVLDGRDSGLSISAYPGEAPVLSGGAPLSGLAWARAEAPGASPPTGATVWAADLADQPGLVLPFSALFAPDGRRATRARFPNGDAERDIAPMGTTKANAWRPAWKFPNDLVQLNPLLEPDTRAACPPDACRADGPQGIGPPWAIFCCFFWGWNATATNWTTGSFWGTQPGPPGGGTAQMPGGLVAGNDTLPRLAHWATGVSDMIVHAYHESYWGDWAWTLQSVDTTSGEIDFSRGGFQEGRGSGRGDALYYENILAELVRGGAGVQRGWVGGGVWRGECRRVLASTFHPPPLPNPH